MQLQQLRGQQAQSEQEIAALRDQFNALATQQAESATAISQVGERVNVIETEIAAHTRSLEELEKMQAVLQEQNDASSAELTRRVTMMKAMELLSRARLFMYQSNFGLAEQDAQTARDLLATVRTDAPESLASELDAVLLRLDLTLTNLPDFPVAASDDLDIAWQILLSGLPPAQAAAETPAPELTATPTPIPPFTPPPTTTMIPTAVP